jgi:phage gp36-like protein
MKYINKDDLVTIIQDQLLDPSLMTAVNTSDETMLDKIELSTIDLIISYISGKYNTTLIFGTPVIRNGVLVQIIAQIVIYRVIKRNAARKVPDDFNTFYTDAIKMLEKVQLGSMALINLPIITAPDGSTAGLVYGNNKNTDFFI